MLDVEFCPFPILSFGQAEVTAYSLRPVFPGVDFYGERDSFSNSMTFDLFFTLAETTGTKPPPTDPSGSPMQMLVWMVFAFVLVYFLTIRPQRKKQMELEQQIKTLKTGDRVITSGGIHGVIANVKSDTSTSLTLKIADNVKIDVEKSAIASILREKPAETKS
jgi:preprotein translocase subunit YajC